jgi:hypothetical protein
MKYVLSGDDHVNTYILLEILTIYLLIICVYLLKKVRYCLDIHGMKHKKKIKKEKREKSGTRNILEVALH